MNLEMKLCLYQVRAVSPIAEDSPGSEQEGDVAEKANQPKTGQKVINSLTGNVGWWIRWLILKVAWRQADNQEGIANGEGNFLQNLLASPIFQGMRGQKVIILSIVILNGG
jgi:hypothetical protein